MRMVSVVRIGSKCTDRLMYLQKSYLYCMYSARIFGFASNMMFSCFPMYWVVLINEKSGFTMCAWVTFSMLGKCLALPS